MIGTNELRTQLSIAAVAIALFCGIANAEELSKRITTDGNPKAKGLSLQMDFPADWKLEEGKRPNVVIKAIKKLGEGRVAVCATTIHLN